MSELEKLKQVLKKHKPQLQRDFKIKKLGIFGSYVRGEQRKNSDVDLLVEFSETPGLFDFMRAENAIAKLLRKRVDLVMKGGIKFNIEQTILREVSYL